MKTKNVLRTQAGECSVACQDENHPRFHSVGIIICNPLIRKASAICTLSVDLLFCLRRTTEVLCKDIGFKTVALEINRIFWYNSIVKVAFFEMVVKINVTRACAADSSEDFLGLTSWLRRVIGAAVFLASNSCWITVCWIFRAFQESLPPAALKEPGKGFFTDTKDGLCE